MAEWAGAVSATEGRDDLAVGNSCVVRAEGRSLAYHLAPERLEVRCGDVLIFERAVSRRDPADPFQRWECEVRGQRESEGGLYGLTCSDRGVRADRPELELDTLTKHVRLWTDDFSVEIALEHAAARTPEQMKELHRVAPAMLEEWSQTKKAPRHAAWLHELEFRGE